MGELFIGGDPRFLAGCMPHLSASDYSATPSVIPKGAGLLGTDAVSVGKAAAEGMPAAVAAAGASVHGGKAPYHHRPTLNLFLRDGEWPSCGVELETEEREDVSLGDMEDALRSNWFHFESDSSLSTGSTEGYELITEPLPPRYYRDPRLWAGLQNVLAPWVESWGYRETGLHVHVGMTQFEGMPELSPYLVAPHDRRFFGKVLASYLYFNVVGRSFTDRVFLRAPGDYCHALEAPKGFLRWREGMTGHEVLRAVLFSAMEYETATSSRPQAAARSAADRFASCATARRMAEVADVRTPGGVARNAPSMLSYGCCFTGHGSEVNVQNEHTIEFRRGKGTLNGASVLRMVEFATLLVRYAAKVVRRPSDEVGPRQIYKYMAENTTSGALKALAEAELKGV